MTQAACRSYGTTRLKSTNWKDIAELIGMTAIVASLIFVGYQLKQDREIAIAEAFQTRAFASAEHLRAYADNENVARAYLRYRFSTDPDGPVPAEVTSGK
jgi:hypothetical protein